MDTFKDTYQLEPEQPGYLGVGGDVFRGGPLHVDEELDKNSKNPVQNRAVTEAASHPPVINDDGYWATWDVSAEAYASTGVKAQGPKGDQGDDYVLTEADKAEIVAAVLDEYPAAAGRSY